MIKLHYLIELVQYEIISNWQDILRTFFNVIQEKFFMADNISDQCGPLNDNWVFAICLDTLGKNNAVVFACVVLYLCKSSILVKSDWIIFNNLFQFSLSHFQIISCNLSSFSCLKSGVTSSVARGGGEDLFLFRWRPFFFFFFGDHLFLGWKNVWNSEFDRQISLNFGEDLFLETTWFWAEKTFQFPSFPRNSVSFSDWLNSLI